MEQTVSSTYFSTRWEWGDDYKNDRHARPGCIRDFFVGGAGGGGLNVLMCGFEAPSPPYTQTHVKSYLQYTHITQIPHTHQAYSHITHTKDGSRVWEYLTSLMNLLKEKEVQAPNTVEQVDIYKWHHTTSTMAASK